MSDKVFFAKQDDRYVFKFLGCFSFILCPAVEAFMRRLFTEKAMQPVTIDMTEATGIDSTGMGILAQIAIHSKRMLEAKPTLLVHDNDIPRILKGMDFEYVFTILHADSGIDADFEEIEPVECAQKEMTQQILGAHRNLMSISPDNKAKFEDIVKTLEKKG
jgi:anti-anti-sigma regulatory factor